MIKAFLRLIACLLPGVAAGSMGELPVLQPETYRSPSGAWELLVDPTHREGSGKGNGRMTRKGNPAWQADLPFTLYDAEVTDTGITAGYAYSHGMAGFGKGGPGTLNAVILDAKGDILLNEKIERDDPQFPGGKPGPLANGILLPPQEDRFILRLASRFQESWRIYQLSTGKKLDTFELRIASQAPEAARFLLDVRPIAGTPLIILHWWCYDEEEKAGALYSIVDLKGHPVWSLHLPDDYTLPHDEAAEDRLREEIRREGGILDTREAGMVELRLVADGQRVKFKVARDDKAKTGWTVSEVSREKFLAPLEAEPKPAVDPPPLRLVDRFVLQDPPGTGAIRDIQEFEIDGEGRFGFLRIEPSETTTFVLVDSNAGLIAEFPLPMVAKTEVHCAWLGASRWVITATAQDEREQTRAWWLDTGTSTVTAIDGFECPAVNAVRGTRDGGFVVLATRHQKFSSTDFLIRFDAAGKEVWKHEGNMNAEASSLFSPEDITVTTAKEIAVVDNIRHTVQLFSLDGAFLRSIDLEKAWKREPNYPSGIMPDAAGGFIVHDFDGSPPFVRMKPDGTVTGEFTPRRNDGRVIDADSRLRAAPDGSLWASDGESFIRISDQGVGGREVGSPPDADKLGDIATVAGDQNGNTYAVDQRTGAVHVFGPDGKKLRVCKPAADDFTKRLHSTHLMIGGDGSVFLRMEDDDRAQRYLHFAPDGTRQGVKRLGLDDISEEWHAQPATGNLLVVGYQAVFLVDPKGKLLAKIDRQADRRWFENLDGAAFASDGCFVVHSTARGLSENSLTFFTAAGAPLSTIQLEKEGFAMIGGYNDGQFTMADKEAIRVHDRDGKVIGTTPADANRSDHFITRAGKELWVVDHHSRKVARYEMPE